MFQSLAQKRTRIPRAENQSLSNAPFSCTNMDVLANYSIFQELQLVHDTGYFSAMPSLEENWQQVNCFNLCLCNLSNFFSRVSALLRARATYTYASSSIYCILHNCNFSTILHMKFKIPRGWNNLMLSCHTAYFLRPIVQCSKTCWEIKNWIIQTETLWIIDLHLSYQCFFSSLGTAQTLDSTALYINACAWLTHNVSGC